MAYMAPMKRLQRVEDDLKERRAQARDRVTAARQRLGEAVVDAWPGVPDEGLVEAVRAAEADLLAAEAGLEAVPGRMEELAAQAQQRRDVEVDKMTRQYQAHREKLRDLLGRVERDLPEHSSELAGHVQVAEAHATGDGIWRDTVAELPRSIRRFVRVEIVKRLPTWTPPAGGDPEVTIEDPTDHSDADDASRAET